ncbi:glycoside hydrolase family 43 protein [Pseudoclavibacter sp. VKM Ac-2867]|uniref:glycoside hydrolase family 43 protein n=1 Tax=Pseudoclavibacter sp. VKM Ac-2867 TaxID=2783829 RepID=UPI00188C3A82|nr:glycoside hydrolase family 43 protein [Pseudoclavibacter sp. VKM Ac-2867]MBF4460113.1 family 43 glycosylhydrolase [Pseudoclavibacter sp. VKM Ac-2867]
MSGAPILAGFYPDPTVCRVGDRYYLANSSFEYFPGVPIFESADLRTWTQVGNALTTSEQLDVRPGIDGASGGIYAPTLRFHDGRFWLITTSIHSVAEGHLLSTAVDPAGPWSTPVRIPGAIGIDPDIAWDYDDVCHLTWSDVIRGGISQMPIDPHTGESLGEVVALWNGTGGSNIEGPHIIRRGSWWYLLAAEGGTGPGHMVTVARAASIDGPYAANPANPILTHRSTSDPVQSTGHADLVELVDGSWAMVHLGTRPLGSFPRWHVLGRETFLVGIDWADGWPVVDEARFEAPAGQLEFTDEFRGEGLDPRWVAPGIDPTSFAQPSANGLRLAKTAVDGNAVPALLACRVQDHEWEVDVAADGDLALSVRIDELHRVAVRRLDGRLEVHMVVGPVEQVLHSTPLPAGDLALSIRVAPQHRVSASRIGPDTISLGWSSTGLYQELAAVDGRYLSTEVAGGFTGRVVGVEALGDGVIVRRFSYSPRSAS